MKTIYVVDGARTPFLKARSGPGPFAASDLATQAGRSLVKCPAFWPADFIAIMPANQRTIASEYSSGACESASTPPASTRWERPH